MKNVNFKALMVATLFIVSMIYFPLIAFGQGEDGDVDEDSEQYGAFEGFHGGFGGIFRENMGYGGNILATLFEMLLLDGVDLEEHEELDSVFVLSATVDELYTGNYSFEEQKDTEEIHYLSFYNATEPMPLYNTSSIEGYAYCLVEKKGSFEYNLTIGAALTLIIWDYDKSFIEAAQKVLDWASRFREAQEEDKVSRKLVSEGVQILAWLLVHINEIFTGDELFVLNPIIWQTLEMNPSEDFWITKTWFDTGDDFQVGGVVDDINLTATESGLLTEWKVAAAITKDSYMQWLLKDFNDADLAETIWTQFSFDVAQLWVKEFYVEIDLGKAADGKDVDEAFEGSRSISL